MIILIDVHACECYTEPQAHDDSLPKWLQGTKDSLQEAKQESTPRFIAKMFGVACGLGKLACIVSAKINCRIKI